MSPASSCFKSVNTMRRAPPPLLKSNRHPRNLKRIHFSGAGGRTSRKTKTRSKLRQTQALARLWQFPHSRSSTRANPSGGPTFGRRSFAREGFCFLSWNAGAGRLLLPEALEGVLHEMRGATHVIVTRGWYEPWRREGLELMFEAHSDCPFCLVLDAAQADRVLLRIDCGARFPLAVWTRTGRKLCQPGCYRVAQCLPCLEPWPQPQSQPVSEEFHHDQAD